MSNKPIKKIDWDKVDAIPENSYNYEEAPELNNEMMKIVFIRQPLANMPDSDIDYSDIPEMDSQTKFARVSNKQFNEFVNSEVV